MAVTIAAAPLPGYAFSDAGLDRSDALRGDSAALQALWPGAKVLLLDAEGRAAADADGQPLHPAGAALPAGPGDAVFLGIDAAGQAYFAIRAGERRDIAHWVDLRRAAVAWSPTVAGAFAYARGMLHWQARSRHCGACGTRVELQRGGFVGHCTGCGTDHYPRVDPAVIMAVGDGRRLLLGRQPGWAPGRWSVLAGFVEPGETPEQAVVREVHEETGVRVRQCRYLAAQPWPFPGSLMLGYIAEGEPDLPRTDGELEDARWFSREEIGQALARGDDDAGTGPTLPGALSIARALIGYWYAQGAGAVTGGRGAG